MKPGIRLAILVPLLTLLSACTSLGDGKQYGGKTGRTRIEIELPSTQPASYGTERQFEAFVVDVFGWDKLNEEFDLPALKEKLRSNAAATEDVDLLRQLVTSLSKNPVERIRSLSIEKDLPLEPLVLVVVFEENLYWETFNPLELSPRRVVLRL